MGDHSHRYRVQSCDQGQNAVKQSRHFMVIGQTSDAAWLAAKRRGRDFTHAQLMDQLFAGIYSFRPASCRKYDHIHQCFRYYMGAPPSLWVAGCKNADSCNSGLQYSSSSQVLWVFLASHNQLRGTHTQLVVEMYSLVVVLVYTAHAHI